MFAAPSRSSDCWFVDIAQASSYLHRHYVRTSVNLEGKGKNWACVHNIPHDEGRKGKGSEEECRRVPLFPYVPFFLSFFFSSFFLLPSFLPMLVLWCAVVASHVSTRNAYIMYRAIFMKNRQKKEKEAVHEFTTK